MKNVHEVRSLGGHNFMRSRKNPPVAYVLRLGKK